MTRTRQEAIAAQKNPIIKAALERMTDEQYTIHRAKMQADRESGALDRTVKAMVRGIVR